MVAAPARLGSDGDGDADLTCVSSATSQPVNFHVTASRGALEMLGCGSGMWKLLGSGIGKLLWVQDPPEVHHQPLHSQDGSEITQKAQDRKLGGAAISCTVLGLCLGAADTTSAFRGCWGHRVTPPWCLLSWLLPCLGGCHVACEQCWGWDSLEGVEASSTSGSAAGKARVSRQRCIVWFGEHPQAAVCVLGGATCTLPLAPKMPKPTAPT